MIYCRFFQSPKFILDYICSPTRDLFYPSTDFCVVFLYAALEIEIHSRKSENEKLLKDIDELKATLLLAISTRY